jgi:hypothetical protein
MANFVKYWMRVWGLCAPKKAEKMKRAVFFDIEFEFKPTAFDFVEAASRQCTPPEVTQAQAAGLFCTLIRNLILLSLYQHSFAERLPSEWCFGCALAARRMLNFQADVMLTPLKRFSVENIELVCECITSLCSKQADPEDTTKENMPVLQGQIRSNVSEIHDLLQRAAAARLASVTRRLLHTRRALSGPPA